MNYRQTTLLAQETTTTAGTKTVDIDIRDVISRITVKFDYANSSHTPNAHPAKIITKVELVDGSDVLASLSGYQIEALMHYETMKERLSELDYRQMVVGGTTYFYGYLVLDLYFGRFLYDPELALDPNQFRMPQLKITHSYTAGGSTPSDARMEVFADVFDEKVVTPVGFLMNREYYSYTLSNAAYEEVDLPTDYPIRKLFVGSLGADKTMEEQVAGVRLSEDNQKRIPVDLDVADYIRTVRQLFGLYQECLVSTTPSVDDYWVYVTPVNKFTTLVSLMEGNPHIGWTAEAMGGRVQMSPSEITVWRALISGYEPHGYFPIIFGDQKDLADWYDVTGGRVKSLKLRLKAGSSVASSSTCEVVTQQLRRY